MHQKRVMNMRTCTRSYFVENLMYCCEEWPDMRKLRSTGRLGVVERLAEVCGRYCSVCCEVILLQTNQSA